GVIRHLLAVSGRKDLSGLRILVIHSGGDSKRAPQYSALGKLFSPVPHELPNGRASTLFDELMIATSSVPSRIREGMMLLSGDVLLLFNPLQIDFSSVGAAAISFKESAETGKNHGVFLRGEDGYVKRFLHKQPVSHLARLGAVNERGAVDIDTGAVLFSGELVSALQGLFWENGAENPEKFNALVNEEVRLSLYGDFLYPLAADSTLEDFYREAPEGSFCPGLTEARTAVWAALSPFKMKLLRLAPAKFIHFGTTGEIMELMSHGVEDYALLGWSKRVNSSVSDAAAGVNSVLSKNASVGKNCYLEVSYVHNGAVIGDNVLLSYVDVQDRTVPSDVVLHGLKQKDGRFVVRVFGIGDNPKANYCDDPGFLGTTLKAFMKNNGIRPEELWSGEDKSIWTARLYPSCATVGEAVDAALNICAMARGEGDAELWRRGERRSLCSGFVDADSEALISWNRRMEELVRMDRLARAIDRGEPAAKAREILQAEALTPVQQDWLEKQISRSDFENLSDISRILRLYYYIGRALGGKEGEKYLSRCFETVQKAVLGAPAPGGIGPNPRIAKDRVCVSLPLRVNFGGGWSDTPPYCLEKGGTVLNAAILLNGQRPVEVTLERIPEKKIVFDSRDMDVHGEFTSLDAVRSTGDPYDPFALQKACLLACGVLPERGGDLESLLEGFGGGFVMRSEVTGVPKGSGLGTSSILSAACVKAVFGFFGKEPADPQIFAHVLRMEQLMSTGGGWQDQAGGLSDGIKYITSAPGFDQELSIRPVEMPQSAKAEFSRRYALIYTGQRRLARNLLRDVVGNYIGSDPEALFALEEIQRLAALMRFELERGDIDSFAALMTRHWELSQAIDKGSANTLIQQIFASVDHLIDGRMVCGAGGGGFLQVILKKDVSPAQLRDRLKEVFEDSDVDLWDCSLV
ncbi:MAG: bifunctional fucokinase/L-fucose-1-P-guanylyltransferase, partial [Clostridia bacterium]|nr:bifunctional fucokinase/L-fucose-1-P-guanylyltransferase [Clostridia bacterium]